MPLITKDYFVVYKDSKQIIITSPAEGKVYTGSKDYAEFDTEEELNNYISANGLYYFDKFADDDE